MSLATTTFYLNGKSGREPKNWQEIGVQTSTVQTDEVNDRVAETVQPSISTIEWEFVGIAAQEIIIHRKSGLTGGNGLFEGMTVREETSDGTTTSTNFNGFINFIDGYRELSANKVVCKLKALDDLDSFDERVRFTSFEWLESIGVFKQADYINIPTIIEPLDRETQLAMMEFELVMMLIEGARLVKEIGKDIATIVAIASTVVGIPGSLVLAIVTLGLDIIFLIILAGQVVNLLIKMAELLTPPVFFNKGAFYKTLLEKAVNHLGYDFETGISELTDVAYMPSTGSGDNPISSGVPKFREFGGTVAGLISIVLRKANARLAIIDGTVHIRTDSDPFWVQNSTLTLKDVGNADSGAIDLQSEEFNPNANQMVGTTVIGFSTDVAEQWTLADDKGVDTQVIRSLGKPASDGRLDLIKGYEQIDIPVALASRKSVLSPAEELLEGIQQALTPLLKTVNSIYSNQIGANLNNFTGNVPPQVQTIISILTGPTRIGAVKISSKTFSIPKSVYLKNISTGAHPDYRIPINHRDLFSSRPLYDKYHISNSFANTNPNTRQRLLFNGREVPFVYADQLKLVNNSYLSNFGGKRAKVEDTDWKRDKDIAIIDYWVEEEYINSITETIITTQ